MKFTWNESKRQANRKKHKGLDFADAEQVFNGPTATAEDTRIPYREQCWNTIGLLGLKVVVITHTETEDEIHIISLREAEKHETEYFFSLF